MNKKVIKIIIDKNNAKIEASAMPVIDYLYALSQFVESLKLHGVDEHQINLSVEFGLHKDEIKESIKDA